MSDPTTSNVDENRFDSLLVHFLGDLGSALNVSNVMIGHRLGLYKAMHECDSLTPRELAVRTGVEPHYAREWLAAQAAGGYIDYDPQKRTYMLNEEQAAALAKEDSPFFVPKTFEFASSLIQG
jgi:hypothetical protein